MYKKLLFITAIATIGWSCSNNTPEESDSQEETMEMDHSDMDHSDMDHDHEATEGMNEAGLMVPDSARVYFGNLQDGMEVTPPVTIEMVVEGMEVRKAGEIVPGTGHHHIIIDGSFSPKGEIVPADGSHIHYGQGQTEATLNLIPGQHTLTLQFANGAHQSYGEKMSSTITVNVVEKK